MRKYLLLMMCLIVSFGVQAQTNGKCGNNLTWSLENGTLTISGTGDMMLFADESDIPWYSFRSTISQVLINDGVTSIGSSAFCDCSNLTSVTIGNSLRGIHYGAFQNCKKLSSISFPMSLVVIDDYAFSGCLNLTEITIPPFVKEIGEAAFFESGIKDVYCTPVMEPNFVYRGGDRVFPSSSVIHVLPEALKNYSSRAWTIKGDIKLSDVSISKESCSMYVGDCETLTATGGPVKWTSSNPLVATVVKGLVLAISEGTTNIKAHSESQYSIQSTNTYIIRTKEVANAYFSTTEVADWNQTTYSLSRFPEVFYIEPAEGNPGCYKITGINGKKVGIGAVSWDFADADNAVWEIENIDGSPTSIIRHGTTKGFGVDVMGLGSGVFTNKSDNFLWIIEKMAVASSIVENSENCATCKVTVKNKTIRLDQTNIRMFTGESLQLTATTVPSSMKVTWESSNNSVATVSTTGRVTAKGPGTVIITASDSSAPSMKATCTITVENGALSLNKSSEILKRGETLQLKATTSIDKELKWKSSVEQVATVSANGLVTAVGTGTTVISAAYSSDETTKDSCIINVMADGLVYVGGVYYRLDGTDAIVTNVLGGDIKEAGLDKPRIEYAGTINLPETINYGGKSYNVTEIDRYAFYYMEQLQSLVVPKSIKKIANSACEKCPILSRVLFMNAAQSQLEVIAEKAFYKCEALDGITMPNSVRTIESSAFQYCSGLTSIAIPNSVTSIGDYAFQYCTSLKTLSLSERLSEISEYVFANCISLDNVKILSNVHTISKSAFRYCSSLNNLSFSDGLNMIDEYAFAECTSLSKLILPTTIASVQNYAFANDGALTYVEVPAGLQGIGACCFADCSNLTQVKFNTTISTMTVGSNAFKGCTRLNRVDIVNMAAWAHTNFNDELANPLSLSHNLYLNNTLVTDAIIPLGTMYINNNVFSGCTSLKSVSIPSTVQYINDNIFYGCTNLKTVKCFATTVPPFIGAEDPAKMNNVFNQATLYVPTASVVQYQNDSWWKRFKSVVGTDEKEPDAIKKTRIDESGANGVFYNISGQRMMKGEGLYIDNGRKVLKH